jgi:hypothetical protein
MGDHPYQPPQVSLERPMALLATEQARPLRAIGLRHEGHLRGAGLLWRWAAVGLLGGVILLLLLVVTMLWTGAPGAYVLGPFALLVGAVAAGLWRFSQRLLDLHPELAFSYAIALFCLLPIGALLGRGPFVGISLALAWTGWAAFCTRGRWLRSDEHRALRLSTPGQRVPVSSGFWVVLVLCLLSGLLARFLEGL